MSRHDGTIKPGIIYGGDEALGRDSGCSADSDSRVVAAQDELT